MATGPLRRRALWVALGWAIVGAILWLSLERSPPDLGFPQSDKVGDVVAYGVLMFWFCELYASPRARLGYAIGFVVLGIAIEFVQRATGYRNFELLDMVADAGGVALGWLAGRLVRGRLVAVIDRALGDRG